MCMQSVRYAVMCFTARHILWSAALVRPERRLPGGWSGGFQPPHARHLRPVSTCCKPASNRRRPASNCRWTASNRRQPASNSRQSASNCRRPASNSRQPASNCRRPASNCSQPASNSRQSASNSRQPASNARHPASSCSPPASNARRPAGNSRHPASNSRQAAAVTGSPPATACVHESGADVQEAGRHRDAGIPRGEAIPEERVSTVDRLHVGSGLAAYPDHVRTVKCSTRCGADRKQLADSFISGQRMLWRWRVPDIASLWELSVLLLPRAVEVRAPRSPEYRRKPSLQPDGPPPLVRKGAVGPFGNCPRSRSLSQVSPVMKERKERT